MEFLAEPAKGFLSKLGELAMESTLKQFQYLIHHKKIVANLKAEHDQLKGIKDILQAWADAKRKNREGIDPNMQIWFSDVASYESEFLKLYEDEVELLNKTKCLGGKCPNLAFKYSMGKQASRSIEYLTSLKEQGIKFQRISYPKDPPTLGSIFTELDDIKSLESRNKLIAEVIEKLKDDNLKRIGICGMGGVGKTTLVKELIKTVDKDKLFDYVVMVAASQNPDYMMIQNEIAGRLGLTLKSEGKKGRGREILARLKEIEGENSKVLVVLDDVWDVVDFECIGLPSLENQRSYCKILFTSRNKKVCENMESQRNFDVSVLDGDEAWYLFQAMAGDVVYERDIYPIAKQVEKECGGLPLAIVIVGRALKNEKKFRWEDALGQLRDSPSSSFSDMQKLVYSRIELSFNINILGGEECKKFLMLCGLFPEDFDIPVESLLRLAMGLRLLKGVGGDMWKARNRVDTWVADLKRCFLLLDSNMPDCVKMHDIVRDVVMSLASKIEYGFMVKSNMKSLKEETILNNIKAISLILNETTTDDDQLENGDGFDQCPTPQLLQVRSKSKEQPVSWLQHLFQGMISTSVLKVLSMQSLCIPKLPSLFQASSVNVLHTLEVEYCDIGDVSVIGKELIHLQVLSFAHSNIKQLPTEIGNLVSLRLLDLTECNDLNFISADVFRRLTRLEELYFRTKNFPWKRNDAMMNELKKLSHQLKVVEMKVRAIEVLGKDLDFKNLKTFWVYMDPYSDFQRSKYLESNILQVSAIDYKSIESISMILPLINKCEILAIRKVKDLKNVSQLGDHQLSHLKDLRVDSCPNLDHLIDCTVPCKAFPEIQSLSLKKLNDLREICHISDQHEVKVPMIEFSKLVTLELIDLPIMIGFSKTIDLNEFHQVQRMSCVQTELTRVEEGTLPMNAKLFSSDWMQQFPKLETILVQNCSSINMVFDMHGYSHLDRQVVFPRLKEIEIVGLNQLTHVWSKATHGVQGFQNLKSLKISECVSLKHVFTPAIVRATTNLEKLEIESCELLENLVTNNEDDEVVDHENKEKLNVILFDKLDSLILSRLPNIVGICAHSDELELPSLTKLKIDDCPKLDVSFLTTSYTKHDNVSVASSSNTSGTRFSNIEENYSRSYNWPVGCMPLCSKLIHQSNLNKKINKASSISEREIKVEVVGRVPLLEELYVKNCDLHDNVFLQEGDETRIRLKPFIDGHLFPNLKSLTVKYCNKISVLFSPPSLRCFERLEKLHLEGCENLKEIVSQAEIEASENKIRFPSLQHLILRRLHNLKAFCQGSYDFDFSSLQEVEVEECPNMEVFSQGSSHTLKLEDVTMVIDSPNNHCTQKSLDEREGDHRRIRPFMDESSLFPNLTSLLVIDCNKINILFSYSSLCSLQHLEKLEVKCCKNIEAITSQEEIEASANKITLPRLQYLLLLELTNLKAFSLSSYDLYFPSLRKVEIRNCSNMDVFSRGISHTPGLEVTILSAYSFGWQHRIQKKDINATIQGYKAFATLRSSETLSWTDLCNKRILGDFIKESTMIITSFDNLLVLVPLNEIQLLQHVRELTVYNCASLVEVFESGTKKGDATIPYQLEEMNLEYLPKLSHVWKHNITEVPKLTSINVTDCHSLKSLLSHSMAKSLVQLQTLLVGRCETMKEIVTKELDKNTEGGDSKVKILFPKLEELILTDLPSLECFCSGDYDYDLLPLCDNNVGDQDKEINHDKVQISFPQLKELILNEVPMLKCFCSGAYDYDIMVSSNEVCPKIATTFPRGNIIVCTPISGDLNLTIHYSHNSEKYMAELQKLETFRGIERDELLLGYIKTETDLNITDYHKLLNCVPSNMMHLFSHVSSLTVSRCVCLEEIFESHDDHEEGDSKIQYELRVMELSSLPNLKHIWKNHGHILGFRYLEFINIRGCRDLKCVFPNVSMATSLPYLYSLVVHKCNKMVEIIGNNSNPISSVQEQQQQQQQQEEEAKIIFPSLIRIELENLPSLNCFCRSSFPCYVEMPDCSWIDIRDCPEMKSFWYNGTLYTPSLESVNVHVENTRIGGDEEEVIQRHLI